MSKIDSLRQTALQQLDTISAKQRFGYFSIPANLSIGDSQFGQKTVEKDEFGRIATEPKNISTKPTATGDMKSSYFNYQRSIYQGDPYLDPGKFDRQEKLKELKAQPEGKDIFKPVTSITKSLATSSYEHMACDNTERNPRARRNQDGAVIIENRNITASPASKIAKELFKSPKYMSSPYDAEHQAQRVHSKIMKKYIQQHKSSLQQTAFKSMSPGNRLFNNSKLVYGLDKPMPQKKQHITDLNIAQHEAKFRPSNPNKSGPLGTIGKFPQYMCQSPVQTKRKIEQEEKKEPFKQKNPESKSRPSPSISLNPLNLRKYLR